MNLLSAAGVGLAVPGQQEDMVEGEYSWDVRLRLMGMWTHRSPWSSSHPGHGTSLATHLAAWPSQGLQDQLSAALCTCNPFEP